MKVQKLLLFLTILIFCNGISKSEQSFFPKKISLKSEVINNENKIFEFGIVKVIDSLLLIYDLGASPEDKLFHLYNKNTFDFITSFGETGNGSDKISTPGFISVDYANKYVWIQEQGEKRKNLVQYDIDSIINYNANKPSRILPYPKDLPFIVEFIPLNENSFVTQIIYDTPALAFFDDEGDVKFIGKDFTNLNYLEWLDEEDYYLLTKHPVLDLYACGYNTRDVLTIMDGKGNYLHQVVGPDSITSKNSSDTQAYLQMASTKNFIYSQYFGVEAMGKEYPNKLNIFDWNGNPIAQIELDVDIMSFALDLENKRILACSKSETPLVYYEFDENELIK